MNFADSSRNCVVLKEEIARLTELLAGRDQEIRVLREKLAAKGLNVRVT